MSLKVALVGNPNCGKTTLFNCLTNSNAKIGNWPGVTIEKKIGTIKSTNYELVDLPGIYSLSPYSPEEEVSRKYIFEENPDVIINIVDSTTLERGLYLTTQLLDLNSKIIIALNMCDILEKRGLSIDIAKLQNKLCSKVVKISALKETGIDELISEIKMPNDRIPSPIFDSNIESTIKVLSNHLDDSCKHKRFVSIKLLEEDPRFHRYLDSNTLKMIHHTASIYDKDLEETIATQRYELIDHIFQECVTTLKNQKTSLSDKIDKVLLNKWISFPIFALILFLIYYLSVGLVGSWTVDLISNMMMNICNIMKNFLYQLYLPDWFISLIIDGILVGVGSVIKFVPQLIILFLCISFLETCGYMSRIALLLDNFFRKLGLNGKSLIPFIVGLGCSVPGIMSTRIIENEHERKITTILTPFMPCSAKLPIIVLFASYFFPSHSGIVAASLYFLAIFIIILSAYIMNQFIFKNTSNAYFLELPDYQLPDIKYIFNDVSDKTLSFIKRAGSTILLCSIAIWFLLSYSVHLEYGVTIDQSILASLGRFISWIFYPILGVNSWEAAVCSIQGIIAKEQVVSSMNIINGFSEASNSSFNIFASNLSFGFFTPASAYAFMIFNLFSAPCLGAISAMKKELGSVKNMFLAILFQTVLAYILASISFLIGTYITTKNIAFSNLILILWLLLFIFVMIKSNFNNQNNACRGCPYFSSCNQ